MIGFLLSLNGANSFMLENGHKNYTTTHSGSSSSSTVLQILNKTTERRRLSHFSAYEEELQTIFFSLKSSDVIMSCLDDDNDGDGDDDSEEVDNDNDKELVDDEMEDMVEEQTETEED
jgi:hypothetical protein